MSKKLLELMIPKPNLFTQTKEFRVFMEPYIATLRNHPDTEKIPLPPELKHLHKFSLESLLLSQNRDLEDMWLIQRINSIECSHRLDPTLDVLLVPNQGQLTELKQVFVNKMNK